MGPHVGESLRRLVLGLQDSLGAEIADALNDPAVVEIMLNPDGNLFVERIGQGMAAEGRLAPQDVETVIGKVAHTLKTEADRDRPIISGELAIGGHRFEGILPPRQLHQCSQSASVPRRLYALNITSLTDQ